MAKLPAVRQRLSHIDEINSQSILDQLTITFLIVRMDCIPCTYFMQRNAVWRHLLTPCTCPPPPPSPHFATLHKFVANVVRSMTRLEAKTDRLRERRNWQQQKQRTGIEREWDRGRGKKWRSEHRAVDTVAWQRKLGATSDNKQTAATYT